MEQIELERLVFKKILSNSIVLANYFNKISPSDFTSDTYRFILECFDRNPSLISNYSPTKIFFEILLRDKIADRQSLSKIATALANIINPNEPINDLDVLIKELKANRMCRDMVSILKNAAMRINPNDIEEVYEDLLKNLLNLPLRGINSGIVAKLREAHEHLQERIEAYTKEGRAKIPTGIKAFDIVMGGFAPGELAIITAGSGQGKSGLMLWWAERMVENGFNTLFITIEMSYEEMMHRYNAIQTGFPITDIANKRIPKQLLGIYYQRLIAANKDPRVRNAFLKECASIPYTDDPKPYLEISKNYPERKAKMYFIDIEACNPSRIDQEIQKLSANIKLDCVFVDFINVMDPDFFNKDRTRELASIAKSLKLLARKHNILVFSAAQLNTVGMSNIDKATTDSVKYSRAIAEYADWLFGFFRTKEDRLLKQLRIRLVKHRHSAECTALLEFDFSNMQVIDLGFDPNSQIPEGYTANGKTIYSSDNIMERYKFLKDLYTNNAIETASDNQDNVTSQENKSQNNNSLKDLLNIDIDEKKMLNKLNQAFGNKIVSVYELNEEGENEFARIDENEPIDQSERKD